MIKDDMKKASIEKLAKAGSSDRNCQMVQMSIWRGVVQTWRRAVRFVPSKCRIFDKTAFIRKLK